MRMREICFRFLSKWMRLWCNYKSDGRSLQMIHSSEANNCCSNGDRIRNDSIENKLLFPRKRQEQGAMRIISFIPIISVFFTSSKYSALFRITTQRLLVAERKQITRIPFIYSWSAIKIFSLNRRRQWSAHSTRTHTRTHTYIHTSKQTNAHARVYGNVYGREKKKWDGSNKLRVVRFISHRSVGLHSVRCSLFRHCHHHRHHRRSHCSVVVVLVLACELNVEI